MARAQGAAARLIATTVASASIVDTHEHLRPVSELRGIGITGLLRHTYLTRALREPDTSANGLSNSYSVHLAEETWEATQSALERVRFTSYYRWLMAGLHELYDLPAQELDPRSWEYLRDEIPRRYADDSWLATILDRAHITAIIWDCNWRPGEWVGPDPRCYPSMRVNSAVAAFHPDATDFEGTNLIRDWSAAFGIDVSRLSHLERLLERVLEANVRGGSRSIKLAIAYDRSLAVDDVPRSEAERIFGTSPTKITAADRRHFGDYIVRLCLDHAASRHLVAQVHTGLARLDGSSPLLLEPLLRAYPTVTFDLFHGGYPWIHEVAALAHNYPNVRLNLTWLPLLSTEVAVSTLKEWLQIVPQIDRISWGGDCFTGEEAYGSVLAFRNVVARALADLVDVGYLTLDAAIAAAHSVLSSGGAATYGVSQP
jgi:Amidohydrolase